jgi:hypothetical protein
VTFFWVLFDASGGASGGRSEEFAEQATAEAWLSEHWADLVASGTVEVALRDGDDERYRMSLLEE